MTSRLAWAAALVGAAPLLVPATLGHDAWAWTVWGRQLAHLDLDTTAGPMFKPLPVLVLAPLSWLEARRRDPRAPRRVAGVTAAVGLALSADLYRTALLGSAEPGFTGTRRYLAGPAPRSHPR